VSVAPRANIFVDADNTLWDTDSVFACAQLKLLEEVEAIVGQQSNVRDKLGFVRELDQLIAARHHARLRYPPRFLANAVAFALRGEPADRASRLAWSGARDQQPLTDSQAESVEASFVSGIRAFPSLRPGVREGLSALHARGYKTRVVTEGDRARVDQTISVHQLEVYIDRTIEAPKHPRLYRRVQQFAGSSTYGYMIGDQLERDIRPAKEAGLRTIYFPGGFKPKWEVLPNDVHPDYQISSFAEVPSIVFGAELPRHKDE
jgi:putative hydrolase of the HAD superfamily